MLSSVASPAGTRLLVSHCSAALHNEHRNILLSDNVHYAIPPPKINLDSLLRMNISLSVLDTLVAASVLRLVRDAPVSDGATTGARMWGWEERQGSIPSDSVRVPH